MKKLVLSLFICLAFTASAFAEDTEYNYQNRMPFYGNYHQYGGKIIEMYGNRSPLYGNKPPMGMYGTKPPMIYGNMYGSMPPMYGNRPPKGVYGNHPPRMYGFMPPRH